MQHQFSNLPHSLTEFGRTPSIARFFGASVKARVRRDELCRKKLASHYELPTPKAVILDITPNEYAFESLFHQLKKHYPATSVRICVALTDSQPVHILNSTIWRLNYHGWDTSRERTDIKVHGFSRLKEFLLNYWCFFSIRVYIFFNQNIIAPKPLQLGYGNWLPILL